MSSLSDYMLVIVKVKGICKGHRYLVSMNSLQPFGSFCTY